MPNYPDEKALLLAVQAGDRQAQTRLYGLYKRRMMGICRRYARHKAEADDIFQESILRVFTHIGAVRQPESLGGWIRSIVIRTALRYDQRPPAETSAEPEPADEPLVDGEADLLAKLGEEELIGLINALPDGYRTVFNLFVVDGYSHAEIGQLLNIQESTSKSQLVKAKARMRRYLHQLGILQYGTC